MSNGDYDPVSSRPEFASAIPSVVPSPSEDLHRLDPNVVKLWRLTHAIAAAVFMMIATVTGLAVDTAIPGGWPWMLVAWVALAALFLWLIFWYPARAYHAWGYRIDEKVLETHRGIWFRVIQLLPLSRLQHVDLHRGPLERSFGLATLILHTAGTHHAILTIPGLGAQEAVRLRDHLVAAGGGDDAV